MNKIKSKQEEENKKKKQNKRKTFIVEKKTLINQSSRDRHFYNFCMYQATNLRIVRESSEEKNLISQFDCPRVRNW